MKKGTLLRWLERVSPDGAKRYELRRNKQADEDEARIVRTYDAGGADRERLDAIAGDVLADAQDETDISECRCSFVLFAYGDDEEKAITSIPIRCNPIRDDGTVDGDAQEETTKGGIVALMMTQTRAMHSVLLQATAPKRQEQAIDYVMGVLRDELKTQREENATLRAENAALRAKVGESDEIAAAIVAEKESQESTAIIAALGSDVLAVIKEIAAAKAAAAAPAPASSNGAAGPATPAHGTGGN